MTTNPPMSPVLTAPVARYFANEATGPEAVALCFTEEAVVLDEHHEHRGRFAIAAWNAASRAKYNFTTEPLSSNAEGDILTVMAKVTGTFPGSPVELCFRFTLEGNLVARLEITPRASTSS
jgi:hypothetical protein